MRKFLFALVIMSLILSGCGEEKNPAPEKILQVEKIDVDLTKLNANMVYSAVFDMVENPAEYRGKVIKILGNYFVSHAPAKDEYHHACVIWDATACRRKLSAEVLRNHVDWQVRRVHDTKNR